MLLQFPLVSIPADASVGVGRSDDEPIETEIKYLNRSKKMSEETKVVQPEAPKVDIEAVKSEARNAEVQRIQEISAIGEQFDKSDLAKQMIESNGRKDYIVAKESWENYLKRNNSIISDLMCG